jgi:hypothetical protein
MKLAIYSSRTRGFDSRNFVVRTDNIQAEQLSEDTVQAPTPDAPSIHGPLNLGASQVRVSFPFLSSPQVVFSLA